MGQESDGSSARHFISETCGVSWSGCRIHCEDDFIPSSLTCLALWCTLARPSPPRLFLSLHSVSYLRTSPQGSNSSWHGGIKIGTLPTWWLASRWSITKAKLPASWTASYDLDLGVFSQQQLAGPAQSQRKGAAKAWPLGGMVPWGDNFGKQLQHCIYYLIKHIKIYEKEFTYLFHKNQLLNSW